METENRKIGPFELGQKLGIGGMGVVYLATYLKTGDKVAVKVLSPELNSDKRLIKRFMREMTILKKLRHKNIVRYFGGGHDGTQHFYAMELMDGGSLEKVLKKKGKLPWEQTIEIGRQVAKALEHAHNHGIIHRDLKPANLFLSKGGRLKLGDFGIARDTQATALTAAGRTVGTYAYMAPEQISGKPPVSRKTDLYALGCVLFELLTGQTPFTEANPAQMLFAHLELEPPRVTSLALDCPIWLEEVVTKLLEKDPEERYFDALAVQVALEEVGTKVAAQQSVAQQTAAGGSSTVAERSELVKILTGKKKKKKKRKVPIYEQMWFLAACLIVLIGGIGWAMWPLSDEDRFARVQLLMETDDPEQWSKARSDLDILSASSEDRFAAPAREYIDKIEMDLAERQATSNAKRNRDPRSEGERLFVKARRFEQLPDRISALNTYRGMVELLGRGDEGPTETDRPFVNLARRKIAEIEASGDKPKGTVEMVNDALRRADEAVNQGEMVKAHEIWNSIVTLYQDNRELERQLQYARARLKGEKIDLIEFGTKPATGSNENSTPPAEKVDNRRNSPERSE